MSPERDAELAELRARATELDNVEARLTEAHNQHEADRAAEGARPEAQATVAKETTGICVARFRQEGQALRLISSALALNEKTVRAELEAQIAKLR